MNFFEISRIFSIFLEWSLQMSYFAAKGCCKWLLQMVLLQMSYFCCKYLSFYKIEKSKIFCHYINQSRKRGFWLIGWIRFEVKSLHFDTIDAKRPPLDRLMTMKLGTGFTKIVLQTTLKFFRAFFVRVEIAFNPYFCSEKPSFCNWFNFLGRKNLRLQTLTAP